MNQDELTAFLQDALETHHEVVIDPVRRSAGTNRHFYATVKERTYFLKHFTTNQLQVVNRQQQFNLQAQLAESGIAVKPVALSASHAFWLEDYITSIHPIPESESLALLLAETLWQIHNLTPSSPVLDLSLEWQRYCNIAGQLFEHTAPNIKGLLNAFNEPDEFCFCHNDLHYSHIVLGKVNKVLDWEYAAIGNRYFDLAACCQVNQLGPNQINDLAAQYARLSGITLDKVLSGINRLKPVVDFTNQLWHNAYNQLN